MTSTNTEWSNAIQRYRLNRYGCNVTELPNDWRDTDVEVDLICTGFGWYAATPEGSCLADGCKSREDALNEARAVIINHYREGDPHMNKQRQADQERDRYVQFLIAEGVETLVRVEDLKINAVVFLPHDGIDYWEVFRKTNEWDRTILILDPALDILDSFQRRQAIVLHRSVLVRSISAAPLPITKEGDRIQNVLKELGLLEGE